MPARLRRLPSLGSEASLQSQLCEWMRLRHPSVMFRSDMAGVRLSRMQAVSAAAVQHGRAWPDLFVAEARGGHHGLFLELKKEGTRLWLKDGSFTKDPHACEQKAVLDELQGRGYFACFAVGFDEASGIVDEYLERR